MIKQIIKNELKSLLGHEASDAEYLSAINYLSEGLNEKSTLTEVQSALYDWRQDNTIECIVCGEYFLIEELENKSDAREIAKGQWCCSVDCCEEYETDRPEGHPSFRI